MSLSPEQRMALKLACELKVQSLKRAQKGSSPAFFELYDKEISLYNELVSMILKM